MRENLIGHTLSHYRVVDRLGEGASAVVYVAEDLVLGRKVVLKLLPPSEADDPEARERVLREARTISRLNHPNICTLFECAEDEGQQFLVMELLDGQPLSALVASGPLPLPQILDLGIQLADALEAAHAQHIVHRDIKPPNIFVTSRGQAKILDFGIAILSQVRRRGVPVDTSAPPAPWGGTLAYMSPEQVRGEALDPRADLFSLGCVLYEMTTGRPAFGGPTPETIAAAILTTPALPLGVVVPGVSEELERIILRALEKPRELRCQSASDLRADLQRVKRHLDAAAVLGRPMDDPQPAPVSRRAAPGAARRRTELAGAVLVTSIVMVLALVGAPLLRDRARATGTRALVLPEVPTVLDQPLVDESTLALNAPEPEASVPAAVPSSRERRRPRVPLVQVPLAAAPAPAVAAHTSAPAPTDPVSPMVPSLEAEFAAARGLEQARHSDAALAAYRDIAEQFPSHPRAAEALYQMGQVTLATRRANRDAEARRLFASVIERYPDGAWATRALVAKGEIEDRQNLYQYDPVLKRAAPSALVTYRQLAALSRTPREREQALWRLAQAYERLRRFDLAADTYGDLAEEFPSTGYDVWAAIGRLYDRQLGNPVAARAAYARVPASSPRYREAQRFLN